MTTNEFISLGNQILKEMHPVYTSENAKDFNQICKKIRLVHDYMYSHPTDINVKHFIHEIINRYKEIFFKKDLIDSFNLPDEYYYHKQIQIIKNLPTTTHPLYQDYLVKIFCMPSEYLSSFYEAFKYILEKYSPVDAVNIHFQQLLTYVKNNKNILKGFRSEYRSLEEEKQDYLGARNNFYYKRWEDYSVLYQTNNIDTIRYNYMDKRKGNIGELYAFHKIMELYYVYFVSRDIKDGLGYDIYYYRDGTENLVEVKTTTNSGEKDYFSLTENEYRVMKESLQRSNVIYTVCRITLDNELNPTYTILHLKDSSTLISNDGNIEYKMCPTIGTSVTFMKTTQKVKVLTPQ